MEEFLEDIMGGVLLITVTEEDHFSITCEGTVENIRNEGFVIGVENFNLFIDDMCKINKEDNLWVITTPKNIKILVTILDKFR